jgi:hypothetical protein
MPEIADLSPHGEPHAHPSGCAEVSKIYLDALAIIRRKCLWTVNFIFHLADVRTPEGRILA